MQTVQSEPSLSEESRTHLDTSSALLEECRLTSQESAGVCGDGGGATCWSSSETDRCPWMTAITSLSLSEVWLNVSMVTSRLVLLNESFQNFSLLFHQPIRELQSLSNGETCQSTCHPSIHLFIHSSIHSFFHPPIHPCSSLSLPLEGSLRELHQAGLQAGLQAAAAGSRLQGALQQLLRFRQQLQDSSSVVENVFGTARETNQLTADTRTTGKSAAPTAASVPC